MESDKRQAAWWSLRDDADMLLAVANGGAVAVLAAVAALAPGISAGLVVSSAPAAACFLLGAVLAGCGALARGRPRRVLRLACLWLATLFLLAGLGLAVAAATGLLEIRLQFRGMDTSTAGIRITND